jgi:hypothetical protein
LFHSRGYLDPYGLTAQPEWTSPPREPQRRPTGQAEFVICDYTIEAGIKEGKQVFYLHRMKVRTEPAIYLQEAFVIFAANFIRWATHWLGEQGQPAKNALDVSHMGIKRQVQVAAHTSAQVSRHSDGWLLTFSQQSAFAGKVLYLPGQL